MKKVVILFAVAIFFKPIIPVIEYVVNYDYISKVLCENKDKPQLKCNGKCHLMKELAKASESDKPSSNPSEKKNTNLENEVLFCGELYNNRILFLKKTLSLKITDRYSNLYHFQKNSLIFHPPIV